MTKETFYYICPPIDDYPEPPLDQSHCEQFECPSCKKMMWLSEAKKKHLFAMTLFNYNIYLRCYRCVNEELSK